MNPQRRPLLITIGAIFMLLTALGELILGIVYMTNRNDATFLADADATTSKVTVYGIVFLVLGAVSLLVAIGLLRGSRAARLLVALVNVGNLVYGVVHLFDGTTGSRSTAVGTIVGSLIVLYMLYGNEQSKAFFA